MGRGSSAKCRGVKDKCRLLPPPTLESRAAAVGASGNHQSEALRRALRQTHFLGLVCHLFVPMKTHTVHSQLIHIIAHRRRTLEYRS